jgi:hypothetical protein
MKNFIWNYQDKTIRGWFVNLVITMTILMLVVIGAFNEEVKTNLKDLSSLIIGFFTVSFGVWKLGNVIEGSQKTGGVENDK